MSTIVSFLKSPRFLSIVYHALCIGAVAILNYFLQSVSTLGLNDSEVVIVGLVLKQVIGAINDFSNGLPTGFVK